MPGQVIAFQAVFPAVIEELAIFFVTREGKPGAANGCAWLCLPQRLEGMGIEIVIFLDRFVADVRLVDRLPDDAPGGRSDLPHEIFAIRFIPLPVRGAAID